MRHLAKLVLLLTTCPCLLAAQPANSSAGKRSFFVLLQHGKSDCEMRYEDERGDFAVVDINVFPVVVGYHITPRLVAQLSSFYGRTAEDGLGATMQVPGGTYTGSKRETHQRWMLPLLLRYVVLPKPFHLQADALVGVAWVHDSYAAYSETSFNGKVIEEQTLSGSGSQPIFTVGIGFRWVFSRRFELVYDHAWNRNLNGNPAYIRQELTGNEWGLTPNRSIGLRYRFNWGKPKPAAAS